MSLHFLIDGYNLIKRNPALANKRLEEGRQALVTFIERHRPQGSLRNSVTIVFDGQPGIYGVPTVSDVRVVFTEYESADDLIKERVQDSKNKKDIIVVTDDRQLMLYVRNLGAGVMSVREFTSKSIFNNSRSLKPGKPAQAGKIITSSFEQLVNQELEQLWLSKKIKKDPADGENS